jgi:hypothetical protein
MRYLKVHRIHSPSLEIRQRQLLVEKRNKDEVVSFKPFLECDHEMKHGDVEQYLGNLKEMVFFSKIIHI